MTRTTSVGPSATLPRFPWPLPDTFPLALSAVHSLRKRRAPPAPGRNDHSVLSTRESDSLARLHGRRHELADGVEDDFELRVVPLLQRGELAGELDVSGQHCSQSNERADDLDADLHGSRALEDGREHGHAVLGKR